MWVVYTFLTISLICSFIVLPPCILSARLSGKEINGHTTYGHLPTPKGSCNVFIQPETNSQRTLI